MKLRARNLWSRKETWILKFDGSSIENSAGAGILIISARGVKPILSFNLALNAPTNRWSMKLW